MERFYIGILNRSFYKGGKIMKKPDFKLRPEQVDMMKLRYCPVVGCPVVFEGSILLVQRSQEVAFYKGYWSGPFGFLDDQRTVEQKVRQEILEEVGLRRRDIISVDVGEPFTSENRRGRKVFIVFPAKVEVRSSKITTDWEARNYTWVENVTLSRCHIVPNFYKVLENFGLS